jgi:DNA invertase Pin-like site-specific DNA recombinase
MYKAAIFVRVSKKEQEYQRQIEDLRVVALAQQMEIVAEIAEKISGSVGNQERDGLQQLLTLARKGQIQKVLVQEVSRLGRSTVEVLQVVEELSALCVSIYVQNFGIETLKGHKRNPIAQFMFTLLAEFARLEREVLRERIMSGMEEARRQGKKIGRPEGRSEEREYFLKKYPSVVRHLKAGISLRKTAKLSEVAINTVRKVNEYVSLKPEKP